MNKKASLNYICVLKYASIFLGFLIFNCLENQVLPYSTSILVTALCLNCSIILTPILYILSFILLGKMGLIASSGIASLFYFILSLIYFKSKNKPSILYCAFITISLIGFIVLGDTTIHISLEKRIFTVLLTTIITCVTIVACKALCIKGLKFKYGIEESCSVVIMLALIGLGLSHLLSPLFFKGFCALVILLSSYIFNSNRSLLISAVLGCSLAIYYGNINYISVYIAWSIIASIIMNFSRFLSAVGIIFTDCALQGIFNIYGGYFMSDLIPVFIGCTIFCIIPTSPIANLKQRLLTFQEKHLTRQSINRNRLLLSNRLYELSSVFAEISSTFTIFKQTQLTPEKAKNYIAIQIKNSICCDCKNLQKCDLQFNNKISCIEKMIDVGFAKGKLSIIDLPKDITDYCIKTTDLIYLTNKMLLDYKNYCKDKANILGGRELIASEAQGVADILSGLALETGTTLSFQRNLEEQLSTTLQKNGYIVSELLIFGQSINTTVSLILAMNEFSINSLQSLISKTLNMQMILQDKILITQDKLYVVFKHSANYDAVFGIAQKVKDNSNKSGDTHSVARLSDDKFLVALSDGMGSGENAEKISATALSLIETFYKAGLTSELILKTVNKLLSINADENFTALDICVIDLNTCKADLIKYGSPYGFILGENGIKIVESNSLPLGILEELKPSVCQTDLSNENIVLLVTDGISDAFGQASELIDYLRTIPNIHPQSLADNVLNKALELSNGKANDDMTALAVRVYKKPKLQ